MDGGRGFFFWVKLVEESCLFVNYEIPFVAENENFCKTTDNYRYRQLDTDDRRNYVFEHLTSVANNV